jgi:hypothetical protein
MGLSVALALTAAAGAADKPTPAARLEAIKKEVADAQAEFYKAAANLDEKKKEDVEKADKLYEAFSKKQEEGFAQALKIAQADPKSDAGFAALEWLLTTPRTFHVGVGKPMMELAKKYYAADPRIGKAIAILAYYPPHEAAENHVAAVELLKAVAEKNPDRTVRGQAVLGLAWVAKKKYQAAEYRQKPNADGLAVAAEKQFEDVVKNYGDCKNLRTRGVRSATATLADEAKSELFELRNLRPGKVAPDIAGEDLDGVTFKLSDYRGKVVVLDFWGDW